MNKTFIALAVLAGFAGSAAAQSSITLYGKIDQAIGKTHGSTDKQIRDGAGSRIGFRGVEDLGGGLKAQFLLEHRLDPDLGTSTSTNFWNGSSYVGLSNSVGSVNIGRQYTGAFILVQNAFDPFGGDTVAGLRGVALTQTGGVARIRIANSLRVDAAFGGLRVAVDTNEKAAGDAPYSLAAQYTMGPLQVGLSYENPEGANDDLTTFGISYNLGIAKVAAAFTNGNTNAATNNKVEGYLVGVTVPVGSSGRVLAGYAQGKIGLQNAQKKASLGYRHDLSKRTFLYADVTQVGKAVTTTENTGYDIGVQHNF